MSTNADGTSGGEGGAAAPVLPSICTACHTTCLDAAIANGEGVNFPLKLFAMLEVHAGDPSYEKVTAWHEDGSSSFVIWDPDAFMKDVVPKHFFKTRTDKFLSFKRLLNQWGFKSMNVCGASRASRWFNEHFVRGNIGGLKLLKRVYVKEPGKRGGERGRHEDEEARSVHQPEGTAEDDDDAARNFHQEEEVPSPPAIADPRPDSGPSKERLTPRDDAEERTAAPRSNDKDSNYAAGRNNSAVRNNKERVTPRVNDVLLGSECPSAYDRAGNRRFSALVGASLNSYLGEMLDKKDWASIAIMVSGNGAGLISTPSANQCGLVEAVIKCVRCNDPVGRFLIQYPGDTRRSGVDKDETTWEIASEETVRSKVHSAFLAAGGLFIRNNPAMMKKLSQWMPEEGPADLTVATRENAAAQQKAQSAASTNDDSDKDKPRKEGAAVPGRHNDVKRNDDRSTTKGDKGMSTAKFFLDLGNHADRLRGRRSFLINLTLMLESVEDMGKSHIVRWTEEGNGFIIADSELCMNDVVPKFFHFNRSKMKMRRSFHEKLARWGFNMVDARKMTKEWESVLYREDFNRESAVCAMKEALETGEDMDTVLRRIGTRSKHHGVSGEKRKVADMLAPVLPAAEQHNMMLLRANVQRLQEASLWSSMNHNLALMQQKSHLMLSQLPRMQQNIMAIPPSNGLSMNQNGPSVQQQSLLQLLAMQQNTSVNANVPASGNSGTLEHTKNSTSLGLGRQQTMNSSQKPEATSQQTERQTNDEISCHQMCPECAAVGITNFIPGAVCMTHGEQRVMPADTPLKNTKERCISRNVDVPFNAADRDVTNALQMPAKRKIQAHLEKRRTQKKPKPVQKTPKRDPKQEPAKRKIQSHLEKRRTQKKPKPLQRTPKRDPKQEPFWFWTHLKPEKIRLLQAKYNIVQVPPSTYRKSHFAITRFDVLCGHQKGVDVGEGNKRYYEIVSDFQSAFLKAEKNSDKNSIARSIVVMVRSYGGRFLRQLEQELFYDIGDDEAEKGALQALQGYEGPHVDEEKMDQPAIPDKRQLVSGEDVALECGVWC